MRRYLIVDDNRELAENLAEIIEDQGAQAVAVASGPEAVEAVRAGRFDALVTDMRMPVMQGAEVVHAIRRLDPGLPVVVITAYTDEDDLEAARREGLLAVLPKPVPVPRLLDLLARARRNGLVALVEDDPALRDNLTELLRDRGFGAVEAGTVAEAERLGGAQPLAALVDLRLPGGADGEALRRLTSRLPQMPKLVITGFPELAPDVPCRGVFPKPFDTGGLLDELERLYRERGG
jgi:CheY-like chemotaxis protein